MKLTSTRWLRGNTHTHTTYSDGDSPPEAVVDWYAGQGYDFLFLTDHNAMIPDDHLARIQGRGLVVWRGEEITMGNVHVSGLGLHELITPHGRYENVPEQRAASGPAERVRWAVEQARTQGGLPSINHPNRWRALTPLDLAAQPDLGLLEIANMGPESAISNVGSHDQPSTDQLWDLLLAAGHRVWGVASDDAHHFKTWGPHRANPGRGWLMVEGPLSRLEDCLAALHEGRFYASTGPELADYRARGREIALDFVAGPVRGELVGPNGQVLDVSDGCSTRFSLPSGVAYARVRATSSSGAKLWTQPHFV